MSYTCAPQQLQHRIGQMVSCSIVVISKIGGRTKNYEVEYQAAEEDSRDAEERPRGVEGIGEEARVVIPG